MPTTPTNSPALDSIGVLVNGALHVADTLRIAAQLHVTQPTPHAPGWLERFGVPAIGLALLGWFINWRLQRSSHKLEDQLSQQKLELDKRLEVHKLGPASMLALLTQRAGVLSQVQLSATREMWAKAVDLHLQVRDLASTLRSLESVQQDDLEVAERLNADNQILAISLEKERAFLPPEVYELAADYFTSVGVALRIVAERTEARRAPSPNPEDARAETRRLREQLTEQHQAVERQYGELADKIRHLTSPRFPSSDPATTSP